MYKSRLNNIIISEKELLGKNKLRLFNIFKDYSLEFINEDCWVYLLSKTFLKRRIVFLFFDDKKICNEVIFREFYFFQKMSLYLMLVLIVL